MDGLYSGKKKSEPIDQNGLTRHRLLVVNTSPTGVLNPRDASSYASLNPNDPSALIPADSQEGGPHFVFSPETPDNRPTLGFEFALLQIGMNTGPLAIPGPGGFNVTVWALIGSTMLSDGSAVPAWASFSTLVGVQLNQLFHSFDVNATAIRFQIENNATFGSIMIAFAEL